VIHDAELAPRIRQTHRILEDQNVSQLEREALLLELLMEMIRRHSVEGLPQHHIGGDHRAIRKVKDYMQAHSSESISLAALAGVAQLSPYYLSRLFRQEAGIPLQSYLPQVRVHHAKRLLASGKPIVFAAQEAGFSDQSHLTRWFKRILGITPGQYLHSRQ
jgi:AraC-like DNA-binding protein